MAPGSSAVPIFVVRTIFVKHLFLQLLLGITLWHCVGSGNAATDGAQDMRPRTIAFRFDDVQDSWLAEAQRAVIELFSERKMKLSLGVIGGHIGKDETIVEVIRSNGKLLSIANHGLNAKNAADGRSLLLHQSIEDSRKDLLAAKDNLLRVFGVAGKTYIPHQNEFNENTLKILRDLGYTRISSACGIHNGLNFCMDYCGNGSGGAACGTPDEFGLIHVPAGAAANWQPVAGSEIYSTERILEEIANSLEQYCFAVVMLHPQDYATAEEALDPEKLKSLEELLGEIKSRSGSLEVVWLEEIEARCQ